MSTSLADLEPEERFELVDVPDGDTRARLLRLGFFDGEVTCRHHIRSGPVIVRRNGTELALGSSLAKQIEVERLSSTGGE